MDVLLYVQLCNNRINRLPNMKDINLFFLWCVPRSVSTAFEKMIANTGDFIVVGEPFIDIYKLGILSPKDFQDAKHKFDHTFDSLVIRSQQEPVFVKDMGYHASPYITDEQLKQAKHVFLIRSPHLSIPSLYKMRPDFHKNETGFKGQYALFLKIRALQDKDPLVIDAEALIHSPASIIQNYFNEIKIEMPSDILSWKSGARDDWIGRESWHIDAINSTGFEKRLIKHDTKKLSVGVQSLIDENQYYYKQLCSYIR